MCTAWHGDYLQYIMSCTFPMQLQCPNMVRLLHHYQTASRIFLLLEYVKGTRLVDFVSTKREQWEKLKRAALAPQPLSTLASKKMSVNDGDDCCPEESKEDECKPSESVKISENPVGETETDEMERMLMELSDIVPPDNQLDNCTEGSDSEVAGDSLDRLASMRKQLEESITTGTESLDSDHRLSTMPEEDSKDESTLNERKSTAIKVEPPTPTTPNQSSVGLYPLSDDAQSGMQSLSVKATGGGPTSTSEPASLPSTSDKMADRTAPLGESLPSGKSSPCFSPSSLRNSPENDYTRSVIDDWSRRLEENVRHWIAQIVVALDHLHTQGVVCRCVFVCMFTLQHCNQAGLIWDQLDSR